jgi:hypothetical protein
MMPAASDKTTITIGDKQYDIDRTRIPYLSSFVSFQRKAQPDTSKLIHGPIPLIDAALKGIELGYRHCFRSIPPELSQHHILCETYDFLCVDILEGESLDDIITNIKAGRPSYELVYKHHTTVKGNKSKARDAAYKLLKLLLVGTFENENKDAVKIFNAVLFVLSHPGTFKRRNRIVTRAAYEERFVVSVKQLSKLDQWPVRSSKDEGEDTDDDVTTEEESSEYCSDYD